MTRTDIDLPKNINSHIDWTYACPTNKECNAISAGVFKSHVMQTHPSVACNALPTDHTIVIYWDFQTSKKNKLSSLRVTNTLCYCIITTSGDNNIKYGSHKHVDPILCLCTGIKLICIRSNMKMEEKPPRGNGTVRNLV